MWSGFRVAAAVATFVLITACEADQRQRVDSVAENAGEVIRSTLTIIDVDLGHGVGTDKKITDGADTFATSDTVFASVHTSGLARQGEIVGRWVFPDSSVLEQQADSVTTEGDGYLAFFLTKPEGLKPGPYRFEVLVSGNEVREKEFTVR